MAVLAAVSTSSIIVVVLYRSLAPRRLKSWRGAEACGLKHFRAEQLHRASTTSQHHHHQLLLSLYAARYAARLSSLVQSAGLQAQCLQCWASMACSTGKSGGLGDPDPGMSSERPQIWPSGRHCLLTFAW
jgi:hypothetical protein